MDILIEDKNHATILIELVELLLFCAFILFHSYLVRRLILYFCLHNLE